MTEIIKYVADDGEEFEDEYDCRVYEWGCAIQDAKFVLLNGDFQKLVIDEPRSYDLAEYIFIPSEKDARKLYDAWDSDLTEVYRPDFLAYYDTPDLGLWAYDWDTEKWYHMGNHIREEEKRADKCMEVINGF